MDRRQLLRWAALLAAVGGAVGLAGCATDGHLLRADLARAPLDLTRVPTAAASASAFGVDLVRAVIGRGGASAGENLICSPLSVLFALSMVRNGAAGPTAAEMDRVLHAPDLTALCAGLNAVDQTLATRTGRRTVGDRKGKVGVDLANAVWGQTGMSWLAPFLDVLAADFGTGVRETDFYGDAAGARAEVNGWVADRTRGRITDIATPEVINADTRLALVNAIYVKAPWQEPFSPADDREFEAPDGPRTVPMVPGAVEAAYQRGEGWQAARIPLLGGELAVTVIRPDSAVADLLTDLDDGGLDRLLHESPGGSVALTLPTFTFRSDLKLRDVLVRLGMPTAFSVDADFSGLTADEALNLDAVAHQGYVALDGEGIEATAATVVTAVGVSGRAEPEHELLVDRPFLFCLHDIALAVPLLVGVVVDPTVTTT